jgi:urease accessory protein
MNRQFVRLSLSLVALALNAAPAIAHHVMGGSMPNTFGEGILSGLGHPIIGFDHFAALVAVGCIAAAHRAAPVLVIGFVVAMMAGVAQHLQGAALPGAEILVALTVIVLGALMLRRQQIHAAHALALFVVAGLIHGYSLGESIYGAETTPLYAYLLGLAVIQGVIALAAMAGARTLAQRSPELSPVRLVGAGIAGIGLAVLMQQVIPGV